MTSSDGAARRKPSGRNARLILVCWTAAIVARIVLSAFSFNGARRFFRLRATKGPAPAALARRVSRCIAIACRAVPRATCLVRAMAAQTVLALRGYESDIHVGVARERDAAFAAHAWLTSGSLIVTGDENGESRRFAPIIGFTDR